MRRIDQAKLGPLVSQGYSYDSLGNSSNILIHFPFLPLYEEISIRELNIPPKEKEGTHKSLTLSTVFCLLIY